MTLILGGSRVTSKWVVTILAALCVPAFVIRFVSLSNPLIEPHPYRQTMSALVTQHFFKNGIDFFHYQSPSGGLFWNVMHEFPVFQFCATLLMYCGITLEVASRLTTLGFFFGGAALFFFILNRLVGLLAATLSVICYIISPYNIIYSRTGLIDFTAQFFMLAMILFVLRADSAKKFSWNVVGAWICGMLAALVKCYIWFIPVVFVFSYCVREFWLRRNRATLWLAAGLVGQVLVTIAWLKWTSVVRGPEWAGLVSFEWIFGTLEQRLDWHNWVPQIKWLFRFVLHDWMAIPYLFAIFFAANRTLVYCSLAITVLPVVILFNSSQHHDYYLMNQVPYIFALVGLGWERIFQLSGKTQAMWLGVIGCLAIHSFSNLHIILGPVFFDYRKNLKEAYALRESSDSGDRIYLEGFNERFDMPLYSERLARPYFRESLKELQPTLLVFKDRVRSYALNDFGEQWIDSESFHFKMIRVGSVGHHDFNMAKHIGLMSAAFGTQFDEILKGQKNFDLCGKKNQAGINSIMIRVPAGQEVTVVSLLTGGEFVFRGGQFLNLPARSSHGCKFLVSVAE